MAKRSPEGGPHDASQGGTGIGPGELLSTLSQPSQESVPARATAIPNKAAIAAQVKGSRSSAEEGARGFGSGAAEASTPRVYANGESGMPSLSRPPRCLWGRGFSRSVYRTPDECSHQPAV